jgi:hypothetical protein
LPGHGGPLVLGRWSRQRHYHLEFQYVVDPKDVSPLQNGKIFLMAQDSFKQWTLMVEEI